MHRTHQTRHDDEHHEETADGGLTVDVAVPHGGGGDKDEVAALPVRQFLYIGRLALSH